MSASTETGTRNAAQSVFGWQGFRFSHPEDWAPLTLTGNRRAGYARLVSSGRFACQVRWQSANSSEGLEKKLESYLKRLQSDAKKQKLPFERRIEKNGRRLSYRWVGEGQGRGVLFFSETCSRVFFLEVTGARKDSLLPEMRAVVDTFESGPFNGRLLWSLFGLCILLPQELTLEQTQFRAGHTKLDFRARGFRLEAQRWAFAEQLVAKHGLENWARSMLGLGQATAISGREGLRFGTPRRLVPPKRAVRALVKVDEENNQIITLLAAGNVDKKGPEWDWFG